MIYRRKQTLNIIFKCFFQIMVFTILRKHYTYVNHKKKFFVKILYNTTFLFTIQHAKADVLLTMKHLLYREQSVIKKRNNMYVYVIPCQA